MKIKMNTLLIIVGIICLTTAYIRAILNSDPSPRHGDMRIVQDGDQFWTEKYASHPGWSRRDVFASLDAAKAEKAQWDAIHNRDESTPKVVMPQ